VHQANNSVERDRPQATLVGSLRGFAAAAAPHVEYNWGQTTVIFFVCSENHETVVCPLFPYDLDVDLAYLLGEVSG